MEKEERIKMNERNKAIYVYELNNERNDLVQKS